MTSPQLALTYLGSLDDRVARYPFCPNPPQRLPRALELDWRIIDSALTGPTGIIEEGFLLHWASLNDPMMSSSVLGTALKHRHLHIFSRSGNLAGLISDRRQRGVTSVKQHEFTLTETRSLQTLSKICQDAGGFVRFPAKRIVDQGTHRLLLKTLKEQRSDLIGRGLGSAALDQFADLYLREREQGADGGPKTARTAWEDAALQLFTRGTGAYSPQVHQLMRIANRVRHVHQAACVQFQTKRPVNVETGLGLGLQDMLLSPPVAQHPTRRKLPPLCVPRLALHQKFASIAPLLLQADGPLAKEKMRWLEALGQLAQNSAAADANEYAYQTQRDYERSIWQACGESPSLETKRDRLKFVANAAAGGAAGAGGAAMWASIGTFGALWRHIVDAPRSPEMLTGDEGGVSRRTMLRAGLSLFVGYQTVGLDGDFEQRLSCLLPDEYADLDAWSHGANNAAHNSSPGRYTSVFCFSTLDPDASARHVQALPVGSVI